MPDTNALAPGTPLPWAQSHREYYDPFFNGNMYSTQVYCLDGQTIATLSWYPDYRADGSVGTHREANAQYIVTACNAFPDLLKALQVCIAELKPFAALIYHDDLRADIQANVSAAEKVVAKVMGEA